MFRLTREVRFAIQSGSGQGNVTNSYAGFPTITEIAPFLALQVTLAGELNAQTQYLRNIKDIDNSVRGHAISCFTETRNPTIALSKTFEILKRDLANVIVESVRLQLSPYLSLSIHASEPDMLRLSQKFEFSASHRLHNPALSDDENRQSFGKCNHPTGHGHNYEVQVTLRGKPNANGLLVDVPAFEKIISDYAIEKLDHKNLNVDVPEFAEVIPTVENIAMTVYRMLKNRFAGIGADLASVTVWETPKTWCEYSE